MKNTVILSNITLASLASVILLSMGWYESHLHQFKVKKGRRYECYFTSVSAYNNL